MLPLKAKSADDFQTPPSALEPLFSFLPRNWVIWEPACGNLNLVKAFDLAGYKTISTDIKKGQDFRLEERECDCIITNPPFSLKEEFLARCYELKKPFALLMPLTALEGQKRQEMYRKHGIEIIIMPKRINFETPNKVTKSSAWFATAWFTNGLNIGKQLTFWEEPD